MNAALASVAIPVENGQAARAKVTSLPDGSWSLAWCLGGGRHVEPFGPSYDDVRRACADAIALNEATGS